MATAQQRRPWWRKAEPAGTNGRVIPLRTRNPHRTRSLTASGFRVDMTDSREAQRQAKLREGWQMTAWQYRDQIPELHYAVAFLANCAARMRLFPAVYPLGGESDAPVPINEAKGIPGGMAIDAISSLIDFGNGHLALANKMYAASTNLSVAGAGWVLGKPNLSSGGVDWSVRSIGEIQVKDDRYYLREVPGDSQGVFAAEELDVQGEVYLSRMWRPHIQWNILADSPIRSCMDTCEALMILRRMIRAAGRSRLAGPGILAVPTEAEIKRPQNDNEDPQADDFIADLAEAMETPITDEGAASALVPIVVQAPAEAIKAIQLISLSQGFRAEDAATRQELLKTLATGFDLPQEIWTGIADLNHWSAWQVDDNTFRHHVEPHVILVCDALTESYLRPALLADGYPPEWVQRVVLWYDPVELVTHPDRAADAFQAHDRFAISDEALRNATGFTDEDAPSVEELERRKIQNIRTLPPNLEMELVRRFDPSLVVPPITTAGTVPGIKPGGVDTGAVVPAVPPPTAGASAPPAVGDTPAPAAPQPSTPAPPSGVHGPPPLAAAGARVPTDDEVRLSRKLSSIDAVLRAQLQVAANAAVLAALETSGRKLRARVAKDETLRTRIAHSTDERVSAALGETVVQGLGLTASALIGSEWSRLESQFRSWVSDAQQQSVDAAMQLANLKADDPAVLAAQMQLQNRIDTGWLYLSQALTNLTHGLLFQPLPNSSSDWGDRDPDKLVSTGLIRATLAIVGGAEAPA